MKKEYMQDCPYYLEDFLTNLLISKERSERTVEGYYIDIRTFLRYLKIKHKVISSDADLSEVSIVDVPIEWIESLNIMEAYEYLKYLKFERQNETATRARKTSALKQFYNYLSKKSKLISVNPLKDLEVPRVKNKLPVFLSLQDSIKLLDSIDSKNKDRDYCIIVLFLNCGMRLSELVGLNISDYSRDNQTLRVLGKGNKQRIVYLNDSCIEALNQYLDAARPNESAKDKNAIFLSANKTRINKRRVQQIVEENLKRAGLSNLGVTTHKLRHTAATLMYQHGNVDTLVLRDVLGHKSIATTEIYTHLSDENLREAADANPLNKVKKNSKHDE
ncbi:MAG: tyrosine recombinase XerC [Ruminococcus sp.]|nr:tyrosine recombinase XerC [Ruminococcus sp.]